jgi:Xaa-Pro dipeptidase
MVYVGEFSSKSMEPKFIFPGLGVVGLEDDYLVTPSGLERLTLTDQTIMTVC